MIDGVKVFEKTIFPDNRGYFIQLDLREVRELFENRDLVLFLSSKSNRGVLRGLHQQVNGKEQAKLVNCPNGKLLDLIVDYRKDSKTYMEKMVVLLDKPNKYIFIPKGCLHGFISLEDNTILSYYVDYEWSPENERPVHWSLIEDAIDWELLKKYDITKEDIIIAEKDNVK